MVYLDTHIAIWICAGEDRLTQAAWNAIENEELLISPAVLLEFQFLRERGRISAGPQELMSTLVNDFGVAIGQHPFSAVCQAAIGLSWTRDPFDRLIVAQAIATQSELITRDEMIRSNFPGAIW
jgi:PIN domain nuclease of toxin-antitoxin system